MWNNYTCRKWSHSVEKTLPFAWDTLVGNNKLPHAWKLFSSIHFSRKSNNSMPFDGLNDRVDQSSITPISCLVSGRSAGISGAPSPMPRRSLVLPAFRLE
jgi:hypothetical protein